MNGPDVLVEREPRLAAEGVARLRADGVDVNYPQNAVLVMEGEVAEHVYLLVRGVVKITGVSPGGLPKLLALRGPGQLVGDHWCLDGSRCRGTVTAVSPVAARRLPADGFLRTVREDASLCFALLEISVARLGESDRMLGELGELSARERVVRLLARLVATCLDDESGDSVIIPVDQSGLAGGAGVARETVCRTVTQLSRRGIAHTRRGRIVVDDIPALIKAAYPAGPG